MRNAKFEVVVTLEIGEITSDSEKITFTVTGAKESSDEAVFAAIYNEDMKLIEVKKYASAASAPAEFAYDATAKYTRVFYVTNETFDPVCVNAEKTIE